MEKEEINSKEIIIEKPVEADKLLIIPVAKISRWCGGWGFLGTKLPVGVVIVSKNDRKAFRVTGEEVSLAEFIEEVPGLEGILTNIDNKGTIS